MPHKTIYETRKLLCKLRDLPILAAKQENIPGRAILINNRASTWCDRTLIELTELSVAIEKVLGMADRLERVRCRFGDNVTMKTESKILLSLDAEILREDAVSKKSQRDEDYTQNGHRPNENKMSDGGRGRASLGVKVWKSSQKWSVRRSAVRSIAWLGLCGFIGGRGATI